MRDGAPDARKVTTDEPNGEIGEIIALSNPDDHEDTSPSDASEQPKTLQRGSPDPVLALVQRVALFLPHLETFARSDGWWIPADDFEIWRESYDEYNLRAARIIRTHGSLSACRGWARSTICDKCDSKFSKMEYGKETRVMFLNLKNSEYWKSATNTDEGFDPLEVMAKEVIKGTHDSLSERKDKP